MSDSVCLCLGVWVSAREIVSYLTEMTRIFKTKLDSVQPSQLYISSEKLQSVMKILRQSKDVVIEPIPVKKLGGQIVFVDGHTRALAALLLGLSEIPVYYWKNEDEELDWDEYEIYVRWCKEENIHKISDLENRIVPHTDYQILWLDKCRRMQQDLEAERKIRRTSRPDT